MTRFPIQGTAEKGRAPRGSIPWSLIAPHEKQALKNHDGQSLEKLASRGGLSWREALAVLEDRPFGDRLEEGEARSLVLAMVPGLEVAP